MTIALREFKIDVSRQVPVPVWLRGHKVGDFRVDLLIKNSAFPEIRIRVNPCESVAGVSA